MALSEVSPSPEVTRTHDDLRSHDVSRSASSTTPAPIEIHTDDQIRAEQAMVRVSIIGFLIALPIAIGVLVGMMALAIGDAQPWYVWLGLGVTMGVYAAGFLGSMVGVLASARTLNRIAGGRFL
jgi:hypothetical protein